MLPMSEGDKDYVNINTAHLGARPIGLTPSIPQPPAQADPGLLIETISSMYETVADPTQWEKALDHLSRLVHSKDCISGVFDVSCPAVHRHSASSGVSRSGLDKLLTLAAAERFERFEQLYHLPPQTLMHFPDHDTAKNPKQDGFIQELKNRYDIHRLISANANPYASWFDYVTLFYGPDHATMNRVENETISFLLPHMAKANATRRPLEILKQKYQAVFQALDWLTFGVILVSPDQSIIATNQAADAILETKDGLRRTQDHRVVATRPEADMAFHASIHDAIAAAQKQAPSLCQAISLPRQSGAAPYILEIAPFIDTPSGELNMAVKAALIFCIDPETHAKISPKGLAEAYRLTPTETEICGHVLEGLSNEDIAEARNVGLSTIKTHVKALLAKTHTQNRLGLLRLAVSVTPPIKDEA